MKKKILILLLLLITLSGCTKRFNVEQEDKTKKAYVSNILCKPQSEELKSVYKENKDKLIVDYDKLPQCKNLKINSGGYEGLWTSIFVKPLAWVIVKIGNLVKNNGLAIMIVGLILRVCLYPLSKKTTNMSDNMKKAQKDLNRLEKKYEGKTEKDAMMAKSQEMMMIYKKYNISPMSGCLPAFLQLPILMAFLDAINRVPAIFEENFLGFHLGTTPKVGITNGNWLYIILTILVAVTTFFSLAKAQNNSAGNDEMAKQTKTMMNVFTIMIIVMSVFMSSALNIYWIISNAFTLLQNYLVKRSIK